MCSTNRTRFLCALGIFFYLISGQVFAQTDLAQNKKVAASSALQPAINAVDGNGGSRWESTQGVDPSWISVDLGKQYALTSIVIDWEAANAADYLVQGSTDNSTWVNLASRTGLAYGTRTDTNIVSGNYQYVRIYGTKRSAGNQWGYSIWSFKVYGNAVVASSSSLASSKSSSTTSSSVASTGINLALGKSTEASTNMQPSANAVDGNSGSRWESTHGIDPSWISVDLGAPATLTSIVIDWEAANAAAYQVQGSNDKTNWTILASRTGGIAGNRTDTNAVSGSFRYVRIYGTARTSQYGYSIFELKVYGAVNSTSSTSSSSSIKSNSSSLATSVSSSSLNAVVTNLALKKKTDASTKAQSPSNAVDGSGTTRWESQQGVDPSWISVDLGAPAILSSIVIDWEAANAADYQVQVSNDKTNWTTLVNVIGAAQGARTDTHNVSGTYQYVRIYGTRRNTAYGYSIYELKVFGVSTVSSSSSSSTTSYASAPLGNITPLFDNKTALEPDTVIEFADHIETTFSDRSRDRHAREVRPEGTPVFTDETGFLRAMEAGSGYEHYLPHYWLDRTVTVIIKDYIAKGGDFIDVDMYSQVPMQSTGTRFFYLGTGTTALYMDNSGVTEVPGEKNHFKLSLTQNNPVLKDYWKNTNNEGRRLLQIGDRIEMEIAQFFDANYIEPLTSRNLYYGTALLYVVGGGKGEDQTGLIPWVGKPTQDTDEQGNFLVCEPHNTEPTCPTIYDSFPMPQKAQLGGRTTIHQNISNEPWHSFKQEATNMGGGNLTQMKAGGNAELFMLGRRLVHTDMQTGIHSELPQNPNNLTDVQSNEPLVVMKGKVGPRFYNASCVGCHFNNGRSIPRAIGSTINNQAVKISSDATGNTPHSAFGKSLQPFSTTGGSGIGEAQTQLAGFVTAPSYADGTPNNLLKPKYNFVNGTVPTFFSVRSSPPFVGLGLLEAVPEGEILAIAQANNGAGIAGKVAHVVDPATNQTHLGRFGWKASVASVRDQIALALNMEMGVTTSVFNKLDCGTAQVDCQTGTELADSDLDLMTRYINTLGVPGRRNLDDATTLRGEAVFNQVGCTGCHKDTLVTSEYARFAELRSQVIHPYTDLLLHDMGPGLTDNMGEGDATGAQWRTAPLWGIGLTADVAGGGREAYMHDGRAKTLTDAILWHDGEAANSRKSFNALPQTDKDALVKFLKSL